MRKLFLGAFASIAVVLVLTFMAGPGAIDRRMNRVGNRSPYSISERASRLLHRFDIVDLHTDTLLWSRNVLVRSDRGHVDVPRLLESNVALQCFAVVTQVPRRLNFVSNTDETDNILPLAILQRWPIRSWRSRTDRALYQAGRLVASAAQSNGKLQVIRSAHDLRAYLNRRRYDRQITAGILAIEGAQALDGKPANVDALYEAGFRMMSLSHFFDTEFGGSSTGTSRSGLSAEGRELVRRMEALGMIIDLAHAAPATIHDVLSIAKRPVIVSHTGVKGTCLTTRNLSDAELRGAASTGGLIGIAYFEQATCGTDPAAIGAAIRHAVRVAGVDHVALGSDFDGATKIPFDASGLGLVVDALLSAGLTESEIELVVGGNSIRVLRELL